MIQLRRWCYLTHFRTREGETQFMHLKISEFSILIAGFQGKHWNFKCIQLRLNIYVNTFMYFFYMLKHNFFPLRTYIKNIEAPMIVRPLSPFGKNKKRKKKSLNGCRKFSNHYLLVWWSNLTSGNPGRSVEHWHIFMVASASVTETLSHKIYWFVCDFISHPLLQSTLSDWSSILFQVNPHTHQLKLCDFGSAKVLVGYTVAHIFIPFMPCLYSNVYLLSMKSSLFSSAGIHFFILMLLCSFRGQSANPFDHDLFEYYTNIGTRQ